MLRLNWSCLRDLETSNAAPGKFSEVIRDPGSARGEDSPETSLPPYHVLQMENFPQQVKAFAQGLTAGLASYFTERY